MKTISNDSNWRWKFIPLLTLLLIGFSAGFESGSFAQDESPETKSAESKQDAKPEKPSPTKQISKLKSQLREKIASLAKKHASAKTDDDRAAVVNARRNAETDFVESLLAVTRERDSANRNVRDLVWFFSRTKGVAREMIYNELMDRFGESSELDDLAKAIANTSSPDAQVEEWLVGLIEKSPQEKVKGAATFELVNYLEKVQAVVSRTAPEDASDYLKQRTEDELSAKIDSLLKSCVEDFSDTKYGRNKIGYLAESKIAQMSLQVGRVAPDIVGVDLDDVEFKLSDYRGKVVMIDFWGDW